MVIILLMEVIQMGEFEEKVYNHGREAALYEGSQAVANLDELTSVGIDPWDLVERGFADVRDNRMRPVTSRMEVKRDGRIIPLD